VTVAYIFAADSIWVYLHSKFCGGLQKTHLFWERMLISAVQGHQMSMILVPNESGVCVSSRTSIVAVYGRSYLTYRFWDTATYWQKSANFPRAYPCHIRRPRSVTFGCSWIV